MNIERERERHLQNMNVRERREGGLYRKSHITFTEHECKHYYTVIKLLKVTGVLNVFTSSPTH